MGFLRRLFGGTTSDHDSGNEDFDDAAVEALGWDAIDAALVPVYGDQEPKHYGTIIGRARGVDGAC